MAVNDTKIYRKMKSKSCLSIEKNIKWEKNAYYNFKKQFSFENCFFSDKHKGFFLGLS